MSEKKEKYIIYWLLITYTLTFIFFVSNLSKVTSDRVTFFKQQPLAYWFSIFYARQKVTFGGHFWVTRSLFVWGHLLISPTFSLSIVKIRPTVTFAKMTFWNFVHSHDTRKLFLPNKHYGSEPILTFRNATNLQKIWILIFRIVTLHSQAC